MQKYIVIGWALNTHKMDCKKIEQELKNLSVDKVGRIRGKSKCLDGIHAEHLKSVDNKLMEVRIFIAKLSPAYSTSDALKMIDEFIYKLQVG